MRAPETNKAKPSQPRPKAASTTDVLGAASAESQIDPKWNRHYSRLQALHDELLRSRNDLTKDAREEKPTLGTHMADAGTDSYDRDWALSMLSSEQDAVYEIEEAMDRIRLGTYGTCELTGRPIPPDRLNAIPWTRFTAEAERDLENNGIEHRARLGRLGSFRDVSRSAEKEKPEKPA
jgi:RNA polymerase-binding transcription factor DksA